MDEAYMDVLVQSLEKKIKVLETISEENSRQGKLLCQEELDSDAFDQSVAAKEALIGEINFLDDGFEKMYERIKTGLSMELEEHKEKIRLVQGLITKITEKSVKIQKEEADNRRQAEVQFGSIKKKVRQAKASTQVADRYYKSMSKLNYVDPQFMDKKK